MMYTEETDLLQYSIQGLTETGRIALIKVIKGEKPTVAEKIELDRLLFALENQTPLKPTEK